MDYQRNSGFSSDKTKMKYLEQSNIDFYHNYASFIYASYICQESKYYLEDVHQNTIFRGSHRG